MAAYVLVLAALMPLVARFERIPSPATTAPAWRQVSGTLIVCAGLALLAYFGFGGPTPLSTQAVAACLPFAGALAAGLLFAGRLNAARAR
jgi:hypothetical protein